MVDLSLDLALQSSPTYRDLLIVENDLTLTSDADANGTDPVLQDVLQRLSFMAGEWFMDNTQGLPYFQQILVKNPDQSKIDAIFVNTILGTPGITLLESYQFTPDFQNRRLTVTFKARSTTGIVDYSGTVAPIGG